MGYDTVIFDFDGVLVDSGIDGWEWALQARKKVIEENGWSFDLDGFEQTIFKPHHGERVKPYLDDRSISWKQLQELEKAVAEKKIEMAGNGGLKLFPPVEKVLEEIEVRKAVVTNAYGDFLGEMLQNLKISEEIDFWTGPKISDMENYREKMKPDPGLLEKAIEEIDGKNPVMVGDQIEDILAARRAGIDSIYINRDGEKIEKATYSIEDLSEVTEIVQD